MTDITATIDAARTAARADLERLLTIPTISADPAHAADLRTAADLIVDLCRSIGSPDVRTVDAGGHPAVVAHFPGPAGAPTVGLYAHYDVQPTGPLAAWQSDPFTPVERDGRLYARGAADDKGGLAVHLAALRAFDGKPPVSVTLLVEGEEEIGSPTLDGIFARYGDELASDVFVICDSGNWTVGTPAFTTSLRGMGDMFVTVRTLDHALHSGQFGGAAPDAVTTLCRLVATLHDDDGNLVVDGLHSAGAGPLEYPEDRFRAEAGVLDEVRLMGTAPLSERIWFAPAVSVIGMDVTPVDQASNTLYPSARAKLGVRIAPGDDARRAMAAVADHLRRHAPFGARVEVEIGNVGEPCTLPLEGHRADAATAAFTEAFGTEPVRMGMGGSIPLAQAYQNLHPDSMVLCSAVVDPDSRMHGIDESLNLSDWSKACLAEALFLQRLAD